MSFREKFWLTILLGAFAIAHVTGVFMLGSTSAQEPSRAEFINLGD
jgi:hypothetical protein